MAPPPVTLPPLRGHTRLTSALVHAHSRGRLPAILLLHGPPGTGKQRLGLWIAQLLLCSDPVQPQGPCGACQSCRLVGRLEHPDLHWYFPLPRPKGIHTPEKLEEALEAARWEELAARRDEPLRQTSEEGPEGLYLATARAVRKRSERRPSVSSRQVYLIGRAETLVSQDASPEAANALLKVLEEPPEGSFFILTARELGRMLPTIRSRSVLLHVPPVPAAVVLDFLQEELGVDPEAARTLARLARGSIGRAMGLWGDPDGDEQEGPLTLQRRDAYRVLQAALEPTAARGFSLALQQSPSGGRSLADRLVHVEDWLRDLAAVRTGAGEAVADPRAREALEQLASKYPVHPLAPALALTAVEDARERARGNGNPQLVMVSLLTELRRIFRATATPSRPAGVHPTPSAVAST